jgi:hypothetical protein
MASPVCVVEEEQKKEALETEQQLHTKFCLPKPAAH